MTNFTGLVFVVLLTLKLTGTPISWFWVFFPLWIGFALVAGIYLITISIIFLDAMVNSK